MTTVVLPERTGTAMGRSLPVIDARDRVVGSLCFASDWHVEGMLEGAVLRSPLPHAEIEAIDISGALQVPGVVCVLTAEDLRDIDPYYGPVYRDQPILADGRVRYEGEPVAAVAAVDRATALEAVQRIEVRYRRLPIAGTAEAALAPDAPALHEQLRRGGHYRRVVTADPLPEKNVAALFNYRRGDVQSALAGADLVVTGEYRVPMIHQFPLEPLAAVARFDRDSLTVWSGTQTPFQVRQELAAIFGLPLATVRVVALPMGGAFGAKAFPKVEPLAAALARKAGRPVRVVFTMEETARTIARTSWIIRLTSGVRRDGTLVARRCEIIAQIGAYADAAPREVQKGAYVAGGPYRIPHLEITARAVYTNTPPCGAYRGFGAPQVTWAYELHTDEIAERMGMDPLEFRLRNLLGRGEHYGDEDTPIDTDFASVLRDVARRIDWDRPAGPWRGKGLAVSFKPSQSPTTSTAIVRLHADGSASILCGTADMGQGTRTALAQVVAEELGIPVNHVTVQVSDTGLAPFDQTTTSSRSTVVMGRAVQDAARQLRGQLLERASRLTGIPTDELSIEEGVIRGAGESLPVAEVLARTAEVAGADLVAVGQFTVTGPRSPIGQPTPFWEPCWVAAEVEVDPETGKIQVTRLVSAVDAGRAINPQQVKAQDVGSVVQGLGAALYEELVFADGQLLTPSPIEYRLPRASDVPGTIESLVVEGGDGPGPFGAKGVGEGGVMAVAAAIGNAVARATGVRIRELPLKPETVWRALRQVHGTPRGTAASLHDPIRR